MFRLWTLLPSQVWKSGRLLGEEEANVFLDKADVVKPYLDYFVVWVEDEMFMLVKEQ